MTESNPPVDLQAAGLKLPAAAIRRMMLGVVGGEGIAALNGVNDLKVTQNGTPGMSVWVAAGGAFVQGDDVANQGVYWVFNDGTVQKTVPTADATNPRKDIVVARVKDGTEGQAGDIWLIDYIAGTPSGTPAEPALPATALKLATVDVAALASTIVNANITDRRTLFSSPAPAGDAAGVSTSQATGSTTYTDLATVGPAVTVVVPASGKVRISIAAYLNNSGAYTSTVGVALTGANTVSAGAPNELYMDSGQGGRVGISWMMKGLTPGSTTFTLKYKVSNGSGTFAQRTLTVEPLAV